MHVVSVSDLKAHLSRYLRVVKRGGEVHVVERGVPVARLVGLQGLGPRGDATRARLVRAGVLRPGTGDASFLLRQAPVIAAGAGLSAALDEDRGELA